MTTDIKSVLFATDLSEKARTMFRFAAGVAAQHRARLIILHVLQEAPRQSTVTRVITDLLGETRWRQIRDQEAQRARDILIGKKSEAREIRSATAAFCDYMQDRHPAVKFVDDDIVAVQGPVEKTIIATAKENQCDLIVMGYHRHGGLIDAIAGNTVKGVLRRTRIPVLLVPPPDRPA